MLRANSVKYIYKAAIFIMVLLSCSNSHSQDHKLSSEDSLKIDILVNKRMSEMNKIYNRQFKLIKWNGPIQATKNFEIKINQQFITDYIDVKDSLILDWTIALVIAHEYFHLLQFEFYNRTFKEFEHKILEAQADILAGKYFTLRVLDADSMMSNPRLSKKGGFLIGGAVFISAYEFFFKIGTNTYGKSDHPSKEQRVSAIVRGAEFAYGIDGMNRVIYNYTKDSNTINTGTVKSFQKSLEKAKASLNLFKDSSLLIKESCSCADSLFSFSQIMEWSYDQAKLIVHGNAEFLGDLVRIEKPITKSLAENIIVYKTGYKNIGNDTLSFQFENRVCRQLGDTTADWYNRFLLERNKYHSFILSPNESIDVLDTFLLERSRLQGYDVSVISPPSLYGLFYCDIRSRKVEDGKSVISLNQRNFTSINFLNYLELLTDALARHDFTKITADIGQYYKGRDDNGIISHSGVVPTNTQFSCRINRFVGSRNYSTILLRVGEYENYLTADSIYLSYVQLLDSLVGQRGITKDHKSYLNKVIKKYGSQHEFLIGDLDRTTSYELSQFSLRINKTKDFDSPALKYLEGNLSRREVFYKVEIFLKDK